MTVVFDLTLPCKEFDCAWVVTHQVAESPDASQRERRVWLCGYEQVQHLIQTITPSTDPKRHNSGNALIISCLIV
jgi:hypothetical protein